MAKARQRRGGLRAAPGTVMTLSRPTVMPKAVTLMAMTLTGVALLAMTLMGVALLPGALEAQVPGQPPGVTPGGQAPPARAAGEQAPVLPRRPAGEQFYRLSFLELNQYAYKTHPFLQITGDSDFGSGDAASSFSSLQTPATASDENILQKGIHSLPSFGIETGLDLELIFPKAIAVGFDYTRFSQTDKQALDTSKSLVAIPRIQMDTYMYSAYLKGYAFPTNEPGVNFYAGVGLGYLEGKFDAIPFAGAAKERVGFNQTPVGLTQFGVEALGENFGLRYEVRVVRARKVQLAKNPYLDQQDEKEIDFSGTLIKIAVFYQY